MKGVNKMKEIKGITCEAKNCIFHDKSNNCLAGRIEVGSSNAINESETRCKTFECSDTYTCE